MDRRTFTSTLFALPALASLKSSDSNTIHVAVVGAGAFGGWTALHLLRNGVRVTLLDAWGPGNSRASSGGESRVIRYAYGSRLYVGLVARALDIWDENEARWGRRLLHRSGVLFAGAASSRFGLDARPHLEAARVEFEYLNHEEIARRFPQMNPESLDWGIFEPQAGFLRAREGCRAVVEAFVAEGGDFRIGSVSPGTLQGGELEGLELADGSRLTADRYIFACGSWLGRLFPDALGELIQSTRQEVFFFGEPPGVEAFREGHFPVWADFGERVWYGIPSTENRGFKVADDTRGPAFDPTGGERKPSAEGLQRAREYMEYRFPALRGAPLLEARVCQYEQTPDGDLILDRHPDAGNVWFAGGGSGHGYKLGASFGELAAECVLEKQSPESTFSLARFL